MHHEGADHDHDPYRENRLESTHHHCPRVDREGSGLHLEPSEIAPEGHCSFDWGPGIAGDHPRAFHLGEGRRIGPVSREDPNCNLAGAGFGQVVEDEALKLEVVVVDLMAVSDTANTSVLEEQVLGPHNQRVLVVEVLVEEGEQEQKVDIDIVGQEQEVAELEEGVVRSGGIAVVTAAAARQGHNHS